MADDELPDPDVVSATRIVCEHGVVNEFICRSSVVGREVKITMTQSICEACLEKNMALQTLPRALPNS